MPPLQHLSFATVSKRVPGKRLLWRLRLMQPSCLHGNHGLGNSTIGAESGHKCTHGEDWRESRRQIVAR